MLTETWLKPEVLSFEVLPSKYTIYRRDQTDRRGGGVLIADDSTITSDFIKPEVQYDIECICVKLNLSGFFVYNVLIFRRRRSYQSTTFIGN